jgi:hypothetical protein|tara:strand:+ start:1764 stop:2201 length:438 start_codon:yes stop_codon:yes gene_type:complete
MARGFQDYIVYLLLAGLFIVAIYSFASGVAVNYDQDSNLVDDEQINLTQLESELNATRTSAEGWQDKFTSDNFFVALGSIVLFSLWGIFQLMWSVVSTLTTIYIGGLNNVLGVPPLVTGTVTSILIIGLIFAVWKSIKTGESSST